MRIMVRAIALAGLAVTMILSGCAGSLSRDIEMMPAPALSQHPATGSDDQAANLLPAGQPPMDMLYVTNREPVTNDAPVNEKYYSGERGYLLRAGSARIVFGDTDVSWDEARRISLLKDRPGSFPLQVSEASEFGILQDSVSIFTPETIASNVSEKPTNQFVEEVEQRLSRSRQKDVFVYVHGFKVVFDNPVLVSSEMWHFLGYEGAFIAFSWPSTPDAFAYMKDTETARVSAWGLRLLLELLARQTSAERIHIVGYSAGTRVVLNALHDMALMHLGGDLEGLSSRTRLGEVILVGSDVDTGIFASYVLDGLLHVQNRLTLYTSPSDQALGLARRVYSHRRVGQFLPGTLDDRMRQFALTSDRLTLVDVEDADHYDDGNGHAYFRSSPWVSSDVLLTLKYNLGPTERGLARADDSPFWRFPTDYLPRFQEALRQAMAVPIGQTP